jgi:hypothetical protein
VVLPCSDRIARVPPYSYLHALSTRTGLSPIVARLSILFRFLRTQHWPHPRSLATTSGVSVDVLSSGYLDVSVLPVCSNTLYSCEGLAEARGFPIRISPDQSLFAAPRRFSQRTTSFIASQCQGIHQMLLSRLITLIINAHPCLAISHPKTGKPLLGLIADNPTSADRMNGHQCRKTYLCFDLPAAERSRLLRPIAAVHALRHAWPWAMQANPFIHDVNQPQHTLCSSGGNLI